MNLEDKPELDMMLDPQIIEKTAEIDCDGGIHAFPDQNFVVGARVCDICGVVEY